MLMRNTEREKNEFVTVKEIVAMSKNLSTQRVMNVIKARLLRGTHLKDNVYYVPRDIAEDYVFIIDNPKLIRLAILKRAEDVCRTYNTNHMQICKGAGLHGTFLSKLKCTEHYDNITYRTIYKLCQGSTGLRCRISTIVEIAKDENQINNFEIPPVRNYHRTMSSYESKPRYEKKSYKLKTTYRQKINGDIKHYLFSIENEIRELKDRINELEEIVVRVDKTKKDDRRKLKEYNKQNV